MALGTVTASASDIQLDYMKLLVTQLKAQDPEAPMDSNQMVAQIAQLSQLQQAESLNSKFSDVLSTAQRSYASSLVGKQVSFLAQGENGETGLASGVVSEVITNGDQIGLRVGNLAIGLGDVLSVKN
jgi:flagellar basal-body rod modification protein FlgD